MEIIISVRHTDLTDDVRVHVEECMARLSKFEQGISRASVTLTEEKNRCVADATLDVKKGGVVHGEADGPDVRTAIDRLTDKLAKQLKKGRDRRRSHKGRAPEEVMITEEPES